MESEIQRLRKKNALKVIPRLEPYEPNPALVKFANLLAGGPSIRVIIKGLKHKYAHKKDFVCQCRVTEQTAGWHFLKPIQCERWVKNGDLLLSEAERIIRENNLNAATGEGQMILVYKILESKGL